MSAPETASPKAATTAGGALAALRHVPFALVWSGALVSNVGNWMANTGQNWLVYSHEHKADWSGILNFVSLFPAVFLALPMGIVADRVRDRRRLLFVLQVLDTLVAAFMAFAVHRGWTHPLTIVLIALGGGFAAGGMGPVWHSLVPELVPREDLGSAIALNSAQFNLARVIGPLVFEAARVRWGMASAFDLNVASFGLVLLALVLAPRRERLDRPAPRPWREELREGFAASQAHLGIRRLLRAGAVYVLLAGTVFSLLPAIAHRQLGGDAGTFSVLLSSLGVGAVAGAFVMTRIARVASRGRVLVIGALLMAAVFVALPLCRSLDVARPLLFLFGVSWCIFLTTHNTALQLLAEDKLRGRIMSLNVLAFVTAAPLGQLAAGFACEWTSIPLTCWAVAAGLAALGLVLAVRPEPALEG